jgi:hypothetical protein
MADEIAAHPPLPEKPTHADIMAAVRKCQQDINIFAMAQQRNASAAKTIGEAVTRIEAAIGYVSKDLHGELVGEGLCGDLARLTARVDKRFGLYDGFQRYAAGALAAGLLLGLVLWWLIAQRLEFLR